MRQIAPAQSSDGWSHPEGRPYTRRRYVRPRIASRIVLLLLIATIGLGLTACDDSVPPTTRVAVPSDGTTLRKVVTLSADASDNVGVVRVEYRLFGNGYYDHFIGKARTSQYGWVGSWDTVTVKPGTYELASKALDAAGNAAYSPTVTVTVANSLGIAPRTGLVNDQEVEVSWSRPFPPATVNAAIFQCVPGAVPGGFPPTTGPGCVILSYSALSSPTRVRVLEGALGAPDLTCPPADHGKRCRLFLGAFVDDDPTFVVMGDEGISFKSQETG